MKYDFNTYRYTVFNNNWRIYAAHVNSTIKKILKEVLIMYNTFSSSYEPTPAPSISYEEHKIQIIHSIIDLTPIGKLFKLKALLEHSKSVKPTKIIPFLDNLQLTAICRELLKELSNDTHLQPKP